ncbi:DnaB-like helicase N-terminal domain-containing protein [Streptomyces sp. NPDC056190]|uniref:DnaB-like helicase N-terminal domain-containing protein n=1 Tax=Streptomyces sp. NPDC056190 TaxID=3345741 RepID=UPI0035DCB5C8
MATPSYDPVADVARAVCEGDWHEPAHELVWSAVQRLHGASHPTGVPAVEAELRRTGGLERVGGLAGLSQIASDACSPAEAGHYAHLVHGYAQVRRYQSTLVRGMQGARLADPLSVPDAIAAHQAELSTSLPTARPTMTTSAGSVTTWTPTWTASPCPSRRPPSPASPTWTT